MCVNLQLLLHVTSHNLNRCLASATINSWMPPDQTNHLTSTAHYVLGLQTEFLKLARNSPPVECQAAEGISLSESVCTTQPSDLGQDLDCKQEVNIPWEDKGECTWRGCNLMIIEVVHRHQAKCGHVHTSCLFGWNPCSWGHDSFIIINVIKLCGTCSARYILMSILYV